MQVQVSTPELDGREDLAARIEDEVRDALSWFSGRVTRVDVHVRDENAGKGGADDKRCVMEARLRGRQPLAVTHRASTVGEAVSGATEKLRTFIESVVGRIRTF